jgi:hypothetical protein
MDSGVALFPASRPGLSGEQRLSVAGAKAIAALKPITAQTRLFTLHCSRILRTLSSADFGFGIGSCEALNPGLLRRCRNLEKSQSDNILAVPK